MRQLQENQAKQQNYPQLSNGLGGFNNSTGLADTNKTIGSNRFGLPDAPHGLGGINAHNVHNKQNLAALYLRLSRDDGGDSESNSIQNQRMLLAKYAREQGFVIYGEYVDDGVSGTTFERESFKRMISDIEDGKIGIVICKDLSRLGRHNAMVAFYTEIFFMENNVRFICINDGIDSAKGENEIMGFKSIINEFYARDISKKIRSVKTVHAQQGKRLGGVPAYGYMVDPLDKHKLVINPETAPIIRRMFQMSAEGMGIYKIAKTLTLEGIPTPKDSTSGIYTGAEWGTSIIAKMLKSRVYLGNMVSNKHIKPSFKSNKRVRTDESEWVEVTGVHEPIVEQDIFDLVQRRFGVKKRPSSSNPGFENIFVGLAKCFDCGSSLTISRHSGNGTVYLCCYKYRNFTKDKCTPHFIQYNRLYQLVLEGIQENAVIIKANTTNSDTTTLNQRLLENFIRQSLATRTNHSQKADKVVLAKLVKRKSELSQIIKRLFEENVLGNLPSERFYELSSGYEAESKDVSAKITKLETTLADEQNQESKYRHFCDIMLKYTDVTELDATMLYNLIESIDIHAPEGRGKQRTQQVDIHYRFVGEGFVGV